MKNIHIKNVGTYVLTAIALLLTNAFNVQGQSIPELMYFKFDTVIAGAVPNDANPATRVGTATAPLLGAHFVGGSGQFGKGYVGMLGSSGTDYMNTGWITNLTGSWTISLWLDIPTPPTTRYYFGDNTAGSLRCFTGGAASTGLRLTGPFTVNTTTIQPSPKVVHYVYDASTSTLTSYINGVADVSITTTASPVGTTGPFKVGGYASGNSFEGTIDEFRMYNRALSPAEVALTWDKSLPYSPCPTVTGLSVSNIDIVSADLNWDTASGVAGYEYAVTTSATPPASGTATTDTFYHASSLNGATMYYAHVRTTCPTPGNWVTMSFNTDTCFAPALSVSNVTIHSADLSWPAIPGAAGYEYAVTSSATPPSSGTFTLATTHNAVGLSASTGYYAHLRSDCGGTFSNWITEAFTTDSCLAPAISFTSVTPVSVDVSWTTPAGATGYEYAFNNFTNPPSTGTPTTANVYMASGLTQMTTYFFHVRSQCDSDTSLWSTKNVMTNPLGINYQQKDGFNINYFPNPAKDVITLIISGNTELDGNIILTDLSGRVVRTRIINEVKTELDLIGLQPGVYLLRYQDQTHDQTLRINKE